MKNWHVFYSDFLKNRVQVVTKADNQEQALENVKKHERSVASANIMPISEAEYHKFATKWKAVA